MLNKIKKFIKLSKEEREIFYKVLFLSAYYRGKIIFTPYKILKKSFGNLAKDTAKELVPLETLETLELSEEKLLYIKKIKINIERVSKFTPWKTNCLVKALTAKKLLKDREITTTLYLGVAKKEKNTIVAHAWLKVNNFIVTGESDEEFIQVAKYL